MTEKENWKDLHAVKNFYFGNLAYFWQISQVFEQIKESLDNFRQARIDIDVDIVIKYNGPKNVFKRRRYITDH